MHILNHQLANHFHHHMCYPIEASHSRAQNKLQHSTSVTVMTAWQKYVMGQQEKYLLHPSNRPQYPPSLPLRTPLHWHCIWHNLLGVAATVCYSPAVCCFHLHHGDIVRIAMPTTPPVHGELHAQSSRFSAPIIANYAFSICSKMSLQIKLFDH
jgi:hypothetical protein